MQKLIVIFLSIVLVAAMPTMAQNKKEEIKIKTSAQCGQCKDRIERAMAYEKGVVSSDLNLEDKVLTVVYKTGKTTPEKIRKALNELGYDADETLAVLTAYDKLPPCCKKPDGTEPVDHNK